MEDCGDPPGPAPAPPPDPADGLRCTADSLRPDGLYLLSGPLDLLLWVGRGVPPETLLLLFNTHRFSSRCLYRTAKTCSPPRCPRPSPRPR